jgi:hypothetical protein
MANVDLCVRECEKALCSDLSKHSQIVSNLPNKERISLFRNKNYLEIRNILENSKVAIQSKIVSSFYNNHFEFDKILLHKSSNNNKIGADLFHILPNKKVVEIEVKFGLETDKQIGMQQFEKIFGTNIFSKTLDLSTRKLWKEKFLNNRNEEEQFSRLFSRLNDAVDEFNMFIMKKSYTLSLMEQSYMESLVFNNSGDEIKMSNYYLKFAVRDENMKAIKSYQTGVGVWNIQKIEKISEHVKRINIFAINKTTNMGIKYTLNWKNNYRLSTNEKVSAKLGFGSPSWNVWIKFGVTK